MNGSRNGLRAEMAKAPLQLRRQGFHLEHRSMCLRGLEKSEDRWFQIETGVSQASGGDTLELRKRMQLAQSFSAGEVAP